MPSTGVGPEKFEDLARSIEAMPDRLLKVSTDEYGAIHYGAELHSALKTYEGTAYEYKEALKEFRIKMDSATKSAGPSSDDMDRQIVTLAQRVGRAANHLRAVEKISGSGANVTKKAAAMHELVKEPKEQTVIRNLEKVFAIIKEDEERRLSSTPDRQDDLKEKATSTLSQVRDVMPAADDLKLMAEWEFRSGTKKLSHSFGEESIERKDLRQALHRFAEAREAYKHARRFRSERLLLVEKTEAVVKEIEALHESVEALADVEGKLSKWKEDHGKSPRAQDTIANLEEQLKSARHSLSGCLTTTSQEFKLSNRIKQMRLDLKEAHLTMEANTRDAANDLVAAQWRLKRRNIEQDRSLAWSAVPEDRRPLLGEGSEVPEDRRSSLGEGSIESSARSRAGSLDPFRDPPNPYSQSQHSPPPSGDNSLGPFAGDDVTPKKVTRRR